jgi:hypothetical protein
MFVFTRLPDPPVDFGIKDGVVMGWSLSNLTVFEWVLLVSLLAFMCLLVVGVVRLYRRLSWPAPVESERVGVDGV